MQIFRKAKLIQQKMMQLRRQGKTIGLVPTMGALHEGHLSLIKKARRENKIVVASIFVNPAQFGPREDYQRYPRPLGGDKKLLQKAGCDFLFLPSTEEIYPQPYLTFVNVEKLSDRLCGAFRPGHFRGVATVVAKLFNLIQPQRAYFGRKDYQQLKIIEQLNKDLNFPIKIVPCPILREKDGLAKSSRNAYLSREERRQAASLFQALQTVKKMITSENIHSSQKIISELRKIIENNSLARIQYIKAVDPVSLEDIPIVKNQALLALSVWFGKTRLIDNIVVDLKSKR
ncbi:MAG: pantoate--beta-alanine ligase [Elusimicrobiota bacterium]